MSAETETAETTRYRVRAAYVTVKVPGFSGVLPGARGGYAHIGLYRNAMVPADCPDGEVARLLGKGMIEAVDNG